MGDLRVFYHRLVRMGPQKLSERLLLGLLIPFGLLYGTLMRLRAAFYRWHILPSYQASVPVIAIGNLAVGGTGKTPLVDYLVKVLLAEGLRVAVVSRGYGGHKDRAVRVVCAGDGPLLGPQECGDEPFLLARRNPQALVLVSPRRSAAVERAVDELGAEIILLDDGFQHMALQRDFDIVLLDAHSPLSNGRVLPAGLLREPVSALRRGDLFLLTRCDKGIQTDLAVDGPVLHCRHALGDQAVSLKGQQISLLDLQRKRGVAFAGIAEPSGFFAALRDKGLTLMAKLPFADHCGYGATQVRQLSALCADADYLVTTEKDAVKLAGVSLPLPCYQVPMTLEFQEPGVLERHLMMVVRKEK